MTVADAFSSTLPERTETQTQSNDGEEEKKSGDFVVFFFFLSLVIKYYSVFTPILDDLQQVF